MKSFDNSIVNQVQQATDIVELVGEHLSLTKKGREMVGLCPFHDDHRPSLYVNPAKQIFKCFACGAGGDVFKFLQMRENLSFPQAIERLAERAGIKIKPLKSAQGKRDEQPSDVDPNELAKLNAWAARYFHNNLYDTQKGKSARNYIAERQISAESVKKWQLGLALDSRDDLLKTAKKNNLSEKLLAHAGLIITDAENDIASDKFVNRLMFPITDVTGRVTGFGGRTLSETGPKYINSPTTILFDKSNSLYGLEQARHSIVSTGTAVVVEGYTDCIMTHQFGCTNVVATLGTSFTAGQGRILRRYAKKVVLLFDSDAAGAEAANRAMEICVTQHIDIKLASVPQGKDPCDFLLAVGKEPFEKLVEEAVDVLHFKWNRLTERFGSDQTLVGRKAAVEEFLQTIAAGLWAGNLAAIDRGLIINRLSKIIGLEPKEINAELHIRISRIAKTASYTNTTAAENQKTQAADLGRGLFASVQKELIEVLLNEPKLFDSVKQKITADVFDVPILSRIAAILFETLSNEPAAPLARVLAKTDSAQVGNCIVQLARAGEEKGNFQLRLNGALETMQRLLAQKKKDQIKDIKDEKQFLRSVCESAKKQNPHNIGMT